MLMDSSEPDAKLHVSNYHQDDPNILDSIVHSPSPRSYVRNSEIAVTATQGNVGMQVILQKIFEEIMLEVQSRIQNQLLSVRMFES